MDNVLDILQTIHIGAVVATFLFNTGRIMKAVHIFNECLLLLNGKALETIKELTTGVLSMYAINFLMAILLCTITPVR